MSTPGGLNNLLLASAAGSAPTDYQIERSLRFNSSDSAYLSRTPASAGNRKTWTWAGWVKLANLSSSNQYLFTTTFVNATSAGYLYYSANKLNFWDLRQAADGVILSTNAVLRDPSAWYHIVLSVNYSASVSSDRAKLYVNGIEQTYSTATYPNTTESSYFNEATTHYISADFGYINGYLADIHFIDGQALDPSSFGEFDTNGVWQPIDASELTYGTNGFHLPFSDNSTAAALGTDTSPNGNDWTVNNLTASYGNGRYVGDVTGTPYSSAYPVISAFDGNATSTYSQSVNGGDMTFTPSNPISVSSSLKVTAYTTGSTSTFTVNGTDYRSLFTTTGTQTITIPETSITSIVWGRSSDGGSSVQLQAIEVDGSYLIDYAASGNENIDSLVDSPTNYGEDTGAGGEVRGNYATLNPLDKSSSLDLSNGNLTNIGTTTNVMCRSTIFVSSGKWYYEVSLATYSGNPIFGWASSSANLGSWLGNSTSSWGYAANAMKYSNGGESSYGSSYGAGDVIGVAADLDAGTLVFYKNGVSQGTAYSNLSGTICPAFSSGASTTVDFNFGQRPFAYTAPSGFKALCTTNLPEPTIADGSTAMDVALYTGNGSTQTISGLNFSPDLVWIKERSSTSANALWNTVVGVGSYLSSNLTSSEFTTTTELTSIDSGGFTLGSSSATNENSQTYVAWTWDAGSSTVTNTDGSITSQVRANASAGFSVVTWTGNGSASQTVGHGLNAVPELLIQKRRDSSENWLVYHSALGNAAYLKLNAADAAATGSSIWESTDPTSSVFTISNSTWHNASGGTYVSYCFAPVAEYSTSFSYVGNGSADGVFQYLGFLPKLILIKCSSTTGNWVLIDTEREGYNVDNDPLFPNLSNAEATTDLLDITSNGFKLRSTNADVNTSAATYIGYAWASNPFKVSRAR